MAAFTVLDPSMYSGKFGNNAGETPVMGIMGQGSGAWLVKIPAPSSATKSPLAPVEPYPTFNSADKVVVAW